VFILLTNDDGIEAPGLHALAEALSELPDTRLAIVAPMTNRTGVGTQLNFGPINALEHAPVAGVPSWMIDGSPGDAVSVGIQGILRDKLVDLVCSGVNQGLNLGVMVTHSGTIGAALRAVLIGVPALAVSSQTPRNAAIDDFREAAHLARRLIAGWLEGSGLPLVPGDGSLLSLNVPRGYNGHVRWTRQGERYFRLEHYRRDEDGVTFHPVLALDSLEPHAAEALAEGEDTDVGALARGYATLTPLQPRLFSAEAYSRMPAETTIALPPLTISRPSEEDRISLPPGAEVREG
jgi:5'-nucleotidase